MTITWKKKPWKKPEWNKNQYTYYSRKGNNNGIIKIIIIIKVATIEDKNNSCNNCAFDCEM